MPQPPAAAGVWRCRHWQHIVVPFCGGTAADAAEVMSTNASIVIA